MPVNGVKLRDALRHTTGTLCHCQPFDGNLGKAISVKQLIGNLGKAINVQIGNAQVTRRPPGEPLTGNFALRLTVVCRRRNFALRR